MKRRSLREGKAVEGAENPRSAETLRSMGQVRKADGVVRVQSPVDAASPKHELNCRNNTTLLVSAVTCVLD